MKLSRFRWLRPSMIAAVVCLVAIATAAIKARTGPHVEATNIAAPQLLATTTGPAQVIRFTAYDAGIFPKEAKVSAGAVTINFEDLTGASLALVVQANTPQAIATVTLGVGTWRGRGHMVLPAGIYQVVCGARAADRATLIVQP